MYSIHLSRSIEDIVMHRNITQLTVLGGMTGAVLVHFLNSLSCVFVFPESFHCSVLSTWRQI